MAIQTSIEITTKWFREEPTFEPCACCGDVMAANSNGLYLFIGLNLFDPSPACQICNACYEATND
jgi:hypothetical protein